MPAALICSDHLAEGVGVVEIDAERRAVGKRDVEVDDSLLADGNAVAVVERRELRPRVESQDVGAGGDVGGDAQAAEAEARGGRAAAALADGERSAAARGVGRARTSRRRSWR